MNAMTFSTSIIKGDWNSIGFPDETVLTYNALGSSSWQGLIWSEVLTYIDALLDVDFVSSSSLAAEMTIGHRSLSYGTLGLTTMSGLGELTTLAEIELDNTQIRQTANFSGLNLEDYYRYVAAHELGHALGLKHPFDDYPSSNNTTTDDTVMEYGDGSFFTLLDIAALLEKNGIEDDAVNGENPVYRFYNKQNGGHFFTASAEEATWVATSMYEAFHYEGTAFYAAQASASAANSAAIYRFYNTQNGGHFFTADAAERDYVINDLSAYYLYEGIGFYASTADNALSDAVYRFYNQNTGGHFFTSDTTELQTALNISGFIYEGIGFYA